MKMRPQCNAKSGGAKAKRALAKPAFKGWVTSDTDEIEARRRRAETEKMKTLALAGAGIYGDFSVTSSASKLTYRVEIRSLTSHENTCTCSDFRHNGLGTCKHVEAVLVATSQEGQISVCKRDSAGIAAGGNLS